MQTHNSGKVDQVGMGESGMVTEVLGTSCCPSWDPTAQAQTAGKATLSAAGGPKKGVADM